MSRESLKPLFVPAQRSMSKPREMQELQAQDNTLYAALAAAWQRTFVPGGPRAAAVHARAKELCHCQQCGRSLLDLETSTLPARSTSKVLGREPAHSEIDEVGHPMAEPGGRPGGSQVMKPCHRPACAAKASPGAFILNLG